MKQVRQTVLYFQQGSSDKVYEVDLCEVGPGRFVVNYRYGRKGARLKEGSQTVAPLARAEAEKVFDELVQGKIKKGYQQVGSGPSTSAPTSTPPAGDPRAQVVLLRLSRGVIERPAPAPTAPARGRTARKPPTRTWPLERVIWRAGEMQLRGAVPYLIQLTGASALRDYCIAWALGKCAQSGDDKARDTLARLYRNQSGTPAVRRIAGEALRLLSGEQGRAEMPAALQGPDFPAALQGYLAGDNPQHVSVLYDLYLINSETVRPALLQVLRTAPLAPPYFQQLRHIFKAAEYRRDAEVFGLLGHRFEKSRQMFQRRKWRGGIVLADGNTLRTEDAQRQLRDPRSKIAFGATTRTYLRRRVWRTLATLGTSGDPDYVKMAVGVLLPFTDEDAQPPRGSGRISWGPFASYWTLNHILYGKSQRFVPQRNGKAFRFVQSRLRGVGNSRRAASSESDVTWAADVDPGHREEAFPHLWEQRPEGLLHLLSESRCLPVHHFAVKALRACKKVCQELDVEAVIMLLSRPYEVTARLGLELAPAHHRPGTPNQELVLALATSILPEARQLSIRWIDLDRDFFLRDGGFVTTLITSPHADVRSFARRLVLSSAFPDAAARVIIGRIVAYLIGLPAGKETEARDIGDILLTAFARPLRDLGVQVVLDLLGHPMKEVRGLAILLLAQLPENQLVLSGALLAGLCAHAQPDIRDAIRPVVKRLAAEHPIFGDRIAAGLADTLSKTPAKEEDLARHLLRQLLEDLFDHAEHLPREVALLLCAARTAAAQELGGLLLQHHLDWAAQIDTPSLARLGSSDVLAVREACWALFRHILPRLRGDPEEMARAIRLLDATWEDSRTFARGYFRDSFSSDDFTPAIVVSICDSVRPDVQAFGRELCTRHFAEEAGQEYLLKLSQHPSADLQLFATNYLERYARDSVPRLRELVPYFTSVLCRVNKGRVAKGRVLSFLTEEGTKSEEAARLVAEVLSRQSATMAIADRARAIEAMLRIHRAHPAVPLPLSLHPPRQPGKGVRHAL